MAEPASPLQLVKTEDVSWMRGETSPAACDAALKTTEQIFMKLGWRTGLGPEQTSLTSGVNSNERNLTFDISRQEFNKFFVCVEFLGHQVNSAVSVANKGAGFNTEFVPGRCMMAAHCPLRTG